MITDHFWKLNWKIYRSNLQIDYQSGQSNKRTPIELAPSDCRLGFGGREAFCLVATWWRIFVYHSWKASRPVYIFDRVEERPSKLPSNFGRLANRCLNIHGGILMRLLHTWNISYRYSNWFGIARWNWISIFYEIYDRGEIGRDIIYLGPFIASSIDWWWSLSKTFQQRCVTSFRVAQLIDRLPRIGQR